LAARREARPGFGGVVAVLFVVRGKVFLEPMLVSLDA
jgi:hypothetical protein